MTLAEAEAIARPAASPSRILPAPLAILPHDPAADRRELLELAALCGQYSPLVGIEDSLAAECLLMDITGVAELFGGEAALARRVGAELSARGFKARLCVADTVGAAWAGVHWLTHVGKGIPADPYDQATHKNGAAGPLRPQEKSIKPNENRAPGTALYILPRGKTRGVLQALPVEALRLPAETVELLHRLGLWRVGQLEEVPRHELRARLGGELLQRLDQAFGRLPEPVSAAALPACYRVSWSGEHPLVRQEWICEVLEQLLRRLCAMLRRSGRGALVVECRLACLGGGRVPIRLELFQPADVAGHLAELLRLRLDCLRLPGAVVGMELEAVRTASFESVQTRLFDELRGNDHYPKLAPRHTRQDDSRALARLVERLSSRLGNRAVLRVRWLRHCQPELAWEYEPAVSASCPARRKGQQQKAPWRALRPLRLLPEPVQLEISTSASRQRCLWLPDRPAGGEGGCLPGTGIGPETALREFVFGGRRHQVARAWGPERIETGWWRRGGIQRDYYRVETTRGQRYWIFRRLGDGRWFVHGMFE